MNKSSQELSKIYSAALQNYLTVEGEEALHLGYELGRKAIREGLGILDVARIHQEASVAALLPALALAQNQRQLQAVEDFLMEALSPFEAHQRGFRQANIALRELNEKLERRAAELAATNRELSHEISRRKAVMSARSNSPATLPTLSQLTEASSVLNEASVSTTPRVLIRASWQRLTNVMTDWSAFPATKAWVSGCREPSG